MVTFQGMADNGTNGRLLRNVMKEMGCYEEQNGRQEMQKDKGYQ